MTTDALAVRILRTVAAVVAGYAVIVAGTTLTLEVLLGGFGYYESSRLELAAASVGAVVSGLAGGFVAAWIGGRHPVRHALGVLIPLTIDTAFVLTSGISSDPLWFDSIASVTLMASTVVGGLLFARLFAARDAEPATS